MKRLRVLAKIRQHITRNRPVTPLAARTMAQYNRWMNERLYELCPDLSDAERDRNRGAFFKSVHGALNHLLLGDKIWLADMQAGER